MILITTATNISKAIAPNATRIVVPLVQLLLFSLEESVVPSRLTVFSSLSSSFCTSSFAVVIVPGSHSSLDSPQSTVLLTWHLGSALGSQIPKTSKCINNFDWKFSLKSIYKKKQQHNNGRDFLLIANIGFSIISNNAENKLLFVYTQSFTEYLTFR